MDNFEVKPVYENRTYERQRFSFTNQGKEFEGDFHNGEVQWMNPSLTQGLTEEQLKALEAQVSSLLGQQGLK